LNFALAAVIGFGAKRLLIYFIALCWRWGLTEFIAGFSPAGFGIFAGYLLFERTARTRHSVRSGWALVCVFAAVALALGFPSIRSFDGLWCTAAVLLLFPAVVVFAAKLETPPFLHTPFELFGEIIYPLYALHFPIVAIVMFVVGARSSHIAVLPGALLLGLTGLLMISPYAVGSRRDSRAHMSRRGRRIRPSRVRSRPRRGRHARCANTPSSRAAFHT
jgi:peptidoglycan/LPS O-acetylase OafA/YrhL